jgi:hypothetical protein
VISNANASCTKMYHPRRSGKLDREKGLAVSVSGINCTTFGTFCQYRTIRILRSCQSPA